MSGEFGDSDFPTFVSAGNLQACQLQTFLIGRIQTEVAIV